MLIAKLNMSNTEVAIQSGVSPSTVYRYLNGKIVNTSIEVLLELWAKKQEGRQKS